MSQEQRQAAFFGWRVVGAAFLVAIFGWGLGFYGPPVYLEAVTSSRGWPLSLVSGAVTVHFLSGAILVANLAYLHSRFGIAPVTFMGACALVLGIAGWALAPTPSLLYGAAILSGVGWVALGAAAINAMITPWFAAGRPAALSMAYNGASVGGVVFSPLWVALIGWIGFPLAAAVVGLLTLATIGILAGLVLGKTPADLGQVPDGVRSEEKPASADSARLSRTALRYDRAFLSLSAGMALALFAQIGLIAHLVSLLRPALGVQGAGFAAGAATAAAIAGRTLVGWLMPARADRRLVASASLVVQSLGCVLLLCAGGSVPLLLGGVVLIGLGIGNATSLPPLIAQAEFPGAQVGRVVALVVAISQAVYAFAPAAFGLVREVWSDGAVYGAAFVVQLIAAAIYLWGRRGGGPQRF